MALTAEQQSAVELQTAMANINAVESSKQRKLELIKVAKETLIENARYKSIEDRDVSGNDIIALATQLRNYIDS